MGNLRRIRDVNWDEIEAEEARLLREMTLEEGLGTYLALQRAWEPQFRATEALFREERIQYLVTLQERLLRYQDWKGHDVEALYQSVEQLQRRLAYAGIPSAVIGGIAVGVWGNPRVTRDVVLKILLRRDESDRLLALLLPDYKPLQPDPAANLRRNGMVFVHDDHGTRLDLLLAEVDFDETAIRRARSIDLAPGMPAYICTPEDLVIYKLISTREIDHKDAADVLRRQGDALDADYVLDWLRKFEQALDDSTLVRTFEEMQQRWR